MQAIRTERLKAMGLPFSAQYASGERIEAEFLYADTIMKSLRCPVIDVTEKAIEETAGIIMQWLHEL